MTSSSVSSVHPEELAFLDREAVRDGLCRIDVLEVVRDTLRAHACGHTRIPVEGYLPWQNSKDEYTRAIAMLGALEGPEGAWYGMKLINASVGNPSRGLERAGGVSLLFDPLTGRPRLLAEAGLLSAVRTAAYTAVSIDVSGPEVLPEMTLVGLGALARSHIDVLRSAFDELARVVVYDIDPGNVRRFVQWAAEAHPGLLLEAAPCAADAVGATRLLITLTTSSSPYIPLSWLKQGTFVAHVSLDDLLPEVFVGSEGLFVDDVQLVADNPRRILGRLLAEGRVAADQGVPGVRGIDATLGQVMTGQHQAVRPTDGVVVSNPFGMAILDVALLAALSRVTEPTCTLRLV